jgi:hypothetical protein
VGYGIRRDEAGIVGSEVPRTAQSRVDGSSSHHPFSHLIRTAIGSLCLRALYDLRPIATERRCVPGRIPIDLLPFLLYDDRAK